METQKRKRAKHTRSKLGCSVCRIRHVKCDLTRPSCKRCTTTGRKCEGYPELETGDSNFTTSQNTSTRGSTGAIPRPVNVLKINESQAGFLQFYQFQTAAELAGGFEDDLWTRLVLQFSLREDCVRYMVFALASLHRHQNLGRSDSPFVGIAVGHYARALRLLNDHIVFSRGGKLDVTLLCSILCATFEGLQNNIQAAMVHLRSGLKLLHQWSDPSVSDSSSSSSSHMLQTSHWSPSGYLIRSTLSPFYTRLLTQLHCIDQTHHGLTLPTIDEPEGSKDNVFPSFNSLAQARDTIFEHCAESYALRTSPPDLSLTRQKQFHPTPAAAKAAATRRRRFHRLSAKECFAHWSVRLEELFQQHPHAPSTTSGLLLQIWQLGLFLTIENTNKDGDGDGSVVKKKKEGEEGSEEQKPMFSRIVDLIDQFYATTTFSFSADFSTIPMLYFVGLYCPDPQIRGRAIDLLSRTRRKEGMWDSVQTAIMLLEEEETLKKGSPGQEEADLCSADPLTRFLHRDNVNILIK